MRLKRTWWWAESFWKAVRSPPEVYHEKESGSMEQMSKSLTRVPETREYERKYDRTAVFRYIVEYKKRHDGNSPTVRDIVRHFNISSTSVAAHILANLESLGLIRLTAGQDARRGLARGIEVVGGCWQLGKLPAQVQ